MKSISTLILAIVLVSPLSAKADALTTKCLNSIELARLELDNNASAVASVDAFQNDLRVYDQMYRVIASETNPDTLKLDEQGADDQWQLITLDFSAFRPLLSNAVAASVGASCGLAD